MLRSLLVAATAAAVLAAPAGAARPANDDFAADESSRSVRRPARVGLPARASRWSSAADDVGERQAPAPRQQTARYSVVILLQAERLASAAW